MRPRPQLPDRGGRALAGGKITDRDFGNADALFDDNKALAPHGNGACLDLEPEG